MGPADFGQPPDAEPAPLPEEDYEAAMAPRLPRDPITVQQAAEMARKLFRHEE